jgi:class 3 adenylate cyclase
VDAHRRQITVLFTDLVGFTTFSERSGEEAAYTLMRSLSKLMEDAVREHGGVVQSFTGDGIMAVFGAPVAFEDAPLRACRSALDILARLETAAPAIKAKHGMNPQLRIGLNTGAAVIGKVQQASDAGITVLGDTVNFAARLQALADPNSVFMSAATRGLVQGLVDETFAGEHTVKGKAVSQKIYRLNAIRTRTSRFEVAIDRGLTTFVGREYEIGVLQQALDNAQKGKRVIDLAGEPGMGKSRLLYEFQRRIDGNIASILIGNCASDSQQTPFSPFIEIIRDTFQVRTGQDETEVTQKLETGLAALGLHSPRDLGLLLNLLGVNFHQDAISGYDGALIGQLTRDLLQQLLEARSRMSTVVLVIEDQHWVDHASEGLLDRMVSGQATLPMVILTTRRPEYAPPWVNHPIVTELHLNTLPPSDIRRLVHHRLGGEPLPETFVQQVTEKADGNPLFAEELLNYLTEQNISRTAGGLDNSDFANALPATVQAVLTARVDQLPPHDRALLQAASVIGRRFDQRLLAAVLEEKAIEARLSAIGLDLVHPASNSNDYTFKHALVRDALYQSLLGEVRADLHLTIAAEIEFRGGNNLNEVAELLAHHYGLTDRIEKNFAYRSMAGAKCFSRLLKKSSRAWL